MIITTLKSICSLLVWRRSSGLSNWRSCIMPVSYTAWGPVGIVIAHIASCSPLHLFYGFDVLLSTRVPDCRCIFHCWSYNCGICSCFYRCGALFKVPSQEAQSPVSLPTLLTRWSQFIFLSKVTPRYLLASSISRLCPCIWHVVWIGHFFLFGMMCMTEHLVALAHLPGLLPDFKSIKILLE